MAKIQLPVKEPVRAESAPKVGANFGTQNLQAQEKLGNTLQQISQQAGAITHAYAVKHKNAELKTDELNYRAKKLEITAQAEVDASKTSNADEIKGIYARAQNTVDKWVVGNDPQGNPNIRWKDQVSGIQADASVFRVELDGHKLNRLTDLSKATSKARNANAYRVAVNSHDLPGVKQATANMREDGEITKDLQNLYNEQGEAEILRLDVADIQSEMEAAIDAIDYPTYKVAVGKMVGTTAITEQDGVKLLANFNRDVDKSISNEIYDNLYYKSDDLTPEELIEKGNQSLQSVKDLEHLGATKAWHESRINAVIKRAKGLSVNARIKVINGVVEDSIDGKMTTGGGVAVIMSLGGSREDAQTMVGAAYSGGQIQAMGDDTLLGIQESIARYASGKDTPDEAMKRIDKFALEYSDQFKGAQARKAKASAQLQGRYQLSAIMYLNADEENVSAMYDANWFTFQKSAPLKGILAEGSRRIADYLAFGGADDSFVKKANKRLWNLEKSKDGFTAAEINAELDSIFEDQGREIIRGSYEYKKSPAEQFNEVDSEEIVWGKQQVRGRKPLYGNTE